MTVTDVSTNGHGSTGDRARRAWRPGMSGAELGRQLGVAERTGRYWADKLRDENATGKPATAGPAAPPATRAAVPATRKPAGRPRTATSPGKQPAAPPLLVAVTGVAVAVVTAVAAVVSYCHVRDLAVAAGMGDLAGWLPLALDGLVVACSCSLLVDRQRGNEDGKGTSPLAAGGLAIGLAASLAANVLAVDPSLASERVVAVVLAGYTPIALAVSGHLLLRMLGER